MLDQIPTFYVQVSELFVPDNALPADAVLVQVSRSTDRSRARWQRQCRNGAGSQNLRRSRKRSARPTCTAGFELHPLTQRARNSTSVAISSAIEVALDGSVSALQSALVVVLIGAFASLLSSSVADAMTREVHDPNRELIGQGLGNMVSGLIGGLPGGATVLTTVVNIRAGGRSPVAGVIVALLMLAVALGAGRLALPAARPSAASRSSRGDGDDTDRDDLCGCTDVITAVAIGLILAGMANAARLESTELSDDIEEHEVVIFDFTRTSEFDDSAVRVLEQLFHRAEENNSPSIVAGLRGAPADALESIGALDMIPNERRVATLEEARALADRLLLEISPAEPGRHPPATRRITGSVSRNQFRAKARRILQPHVPCRIARFSTATQPPGSRCTRDSPVRT